MNKVFLLLFFQKKKFFLPFTLARRDLRGGLAGLRIVLACLALGVAAIAAVGSLRVGVAEGLARDGAKILGGDIAISGGNQPLPVALGAWLRERGARTSEVVTLRSMLIAPSGDRVLVEVKAVDGAWPLIGRAEVAPAQSMAAALAGGGLLVEPVLRDRLGLKPGEVLKLGRASVVMHGVLEAEPDRVASPSLFGLRAMVGLDLLPQTGLIQPGTIAQYQLRAVLPAGLDAAVVARDIRTKFGDQGWRIRLPGDAAPGLARFIDRTSLFMTLVGLTSLLVGGIGVANGVRAWLEARALSIATLRCLGASGRLVFAVALIQVMALAGLGVLLGLVAGALLPIGAFALLRGVLPVPPVVGVFPAPLALAALYGLLTAAAFALWPLARAMRIPGAALFRDALLPSRVWPRQGGMWWLIAANTLLALALVALTVATAPERHFALWFCAAAVATLALFRAGGWLLMAVARRMRPRLVWLRLGVANLHRPGAATPLLLVSLGIGLSTLAAVALTLGNVRRQVSQQLPDRAPSFFFIDIQDSQMPKFRAIMAADPNATDLTEVPSLRARIVSVNGVPAQQVKATPDTSWALRGDRGLTYAGAMPEGTRMVAGQWWPPDYSGKPLLSFDAVLAAGWGVKLGDPIRLNVLGRDITFTVANLRRIDWGTLGLNFTMIASPAPLSQAPHGHIATVRAPEADQARLLRVVTDALPNVSGIRVADVLGAIAGLLEQISVALAATGSLTLAAGGLVLAGAVAAGQRRRIREAVILKTLGATRGQIRAAWLVEFGILGLVAGGIAALVGLAASWAVVVLLMHADWVPLPGTLAAVVLGCVALMLGFGYAGTEAALRAKAAPLLRNE
jgi:putative ABC transport system permease protein